MTRILEDKELCTLLEGPVSGFSFMVIKFLKFSSIYSLTTYALPPTFTNIILFSIPSHSLSFIFHSNHDPTIRKAKHKRIYSK